MLRHARRRLEGVKTTQDPAETTSATREVEMPICAMQSRQSSLHSATRTLDHTPGISSMLHIMLHGNVACALQTNSQTSDLPTSWASRLQISDIYLLKVSRS